MWLNYVCMMEKGIINNHDCTLYLHKMKIKCREGVLHELQVM